MKDSAVHADRTAEWDELRQRHLHPRDERPASTAGGVHHVALLCSDVERTIRFYQDLLGFPLTALFENRDYKGSTHFFFDIGNGNSLAFFDFPGLGLGPYAEVLAGLHHLAISVDPGGVGGGPGPARSGRHPVSTTAAARSMYFSGPDGERLELLAEPLGRMYGSPVGESGRLVRSARGAGAAP